jgi:hypothetical protein
MPYWTRVKIRIKLLYIVVVKILPATNLDGVVYELLCSFTLPHIRHEKLRRVRKR